MEKLRVLIWREMEMEVGIEGIGLGPEYEVESNGLQVLLNVVIPLKDNSGWKLEQEYLSTEAGVKDLPSFIYVLQ